MNLIKTIRERLELTQSAMGEAMGCTQGNVSHYEQGQTVPPDAARKLIAFAKAKGHEITFDDVYLTGTAVQSPPQPDRFKADLESDPVEGIQLVNLRAKPELATDKAGA